MPDIEPREGLSSENDIQKDGIIGQRTPSQVAINLTSSRLGIAAGPKSTGEVNEYDLPVTLELEAVCLNAPDDAYLASHFDHLGAQLFARFQRVGETKDLDQAVAYQLQAAQLTLNDDAEYPSRLKVLGNSLSARFGRYLVVQDIDQAISYHFESLRLTAKNEPALASRCNEIGNSLFRRFGQSGESTDIDRAILYRLEAVRLIGLGDPNLASWLNNLGNSLLVRFQGFGDAGDIDQAILHQEEAVRLTAKDHPYYGLHLNNLGSSLFLRFKHFDKVSDIDQAISHQQHAVQLVGLDHPDATSLLSNLGISLWRRFKQFGQVDDIDQAIIHHLEAIHLTARDDPALGSRFDNVGISLFTRYQRFGEIRDLDQAISYQLEAICSADTGHPDAAPLLNNLGTCLVRRFDRFGEVKDIDQAIFYHSEAVRLTPADDPDLASLLISLGNSFLTRFVRLGKTDDIDQAINHQTEALRLGATNDDDDLAGMLNDLNVSLLRRFKKFGDAQDLDRAISHQREAVLLTAENRIALAPRLINLGESLLERFECSGDVDDINQAITHQREAVRLTAEDNPDLVLWLKTLGFTLLMRVELGFGELHDVEQARNFLVKAFTNRHGFPPVRYLAAHVLARELHNKGHLEEALIVYRQAIEILPLTMWLGLSASTKLSQLSKADDTVACNAAACAIQLAEMHPDDQQVYLAEAIELLDQSRSILWSQATGLRVELDEILRKRDSSLADELDRHVRAIHEATFTETLMSEGDACNFRRTAERYTEIISTIRELPEFEPFLQPPRISDLQKAASNGHIILMNISDYRCDALIIERDREIKFVPFLNVDSNDVVLLAKALSREVSLFERNSPCSMDRHLHTLWALFGRPIVEHLQLTQLDSIHQRALPRIWWCLTGALTFIPIHACYPKRSRRGSQGSGMMDFAVSSYTPTISTLLRAQQNRNDSVQDGISLLAVAQHEGPLGTSPLIKAAEEVNILRDLSFREFQCLVGEQSTIASVADGLSRCTWAHFACHASQNAENSMSSAIELYDGPLTVAKIAREMTNNGEFVFLSACQSAKGSDANPHESIHIAAALHFTGFRSVVGSMWSVMDIDGPVIVRNFYGYLFSTNHRSPTAEDTARALHHAIKELRKNSVNAARWVSFIHIGV